MANTQIAYINYTIPIPRVSEVSNPPDYIGHGERTITGTFRYDAIDIKDHFTLTSKYLSPDEFHEIDDHIKSVKGGLTKFWIDEFGGDSTTDSVDAQIIISKNDRVSFGRNGVWYNEGHNIELEVIIS